MEQQDLYNLRCKELINNECSYQELNDYQNFKDLFSIEEFKEIIRKKNNRKQKRNRTKHKFLDMLKLALKSPKTKVVFGTLTFNDTSLSTKERTRTKKINEWIKSHFLIAIVNKDFGEKNGREHYHFIGLTTQELEDKNIKSKKGYEIFELKIKDYKLGHEPDLLIIDLKKNDISKTINYLLKLNNHSNKNSTKARVRVIKSKIYEYFIEEDKKTAKNALKIANF